MNQIEALVRAFGRAHLPLIVADRPFVRGVSDTEIVQIDVRRTAPNGRPREDVLLYPGRGAELLVTNVDREREQLVLRVREARRKFHEDRWNPETKRRERLERWTSPEVRRLLVGMDESHLFVAQLTTRSTTVADAHRGLRPEVLEQRPEAARQGEWFFVPVTEVERELVRRAEKKFGIRAHAAIGAHLSARGRPHVASQLVRVRDEERTVEFVRGTVRHPDHKTLPLGDWMRVFMNTENRGVGASWVD
jgi:hypothetical protein